MPPKQSLRKTAQRPVRFTKKQLALIDRAAARRAHQSGEGVTGTEIIREGAIRLANEILAAA